MPNARQVSLKDITEDDVIIALMGPTGTGKSTFIDIATGQNGKTVGHSLQSYTSDIRTVRVPHPRHGRPIVFVDTPGFDDTYKSDADILKLISDWLEKTYKNHIRLAGIIYLHRISDNRMSGSPYKNLRMFGNLCGDDAIRNVILATTMWGRVKEDVGTRRENELKAQYWKPMLNNGSTTDRFLGSFESAWNIVERFVEKARVDALLLQEEIVDLERRLSETKAGITLYNSLQTLLADQKETLRKLQEEAEGQNNVNLVKELNTQYDEVQKALGKTYEQLEVMKIPLGRRILLFFSFKKSRAHALKLDGTNAASVKKGPRFSISSNSSSSRTSRSSSSVSTSTTSSSSSPANTAEDATPGTKVPSPKPGVRFSDQEGGTRPPVGSRKSSGSTTGDETEKKQQPTNDDPSRRDSGRKFIPQFMRRSNSNLTLSTLAKDKALLEEFLQLAERSSPPGAQQPRAITYLKVRVEEEEQTQGGFAYIHRGRLIKGHEQVAIKVLYIRKTVKDGRTRLLKRLAREIRAWHRLDHPNIVKLLGVSFDMKGRPGMIMQWHQNGNASAYLAAGNHSTAIKIMLIKDVARGLTYLHSLNPLVVHGDLKGNNVLVTDDGHAALSDFGLSQVIEETVGPTGLTTSTGGGSTRWQAPEVLDDDLGTADSDADDMNPSERDSGHTPMFTTASEALNSEVPDDEDPEGGDLDNDKPNDSGPLSDDPESGSKRLTTASDVWSFACTAYELLTGKLPFYRRNDHMVSQDILGRVTPQWREKGSLLCEASIELRTHLESCWSFEPSERPSMPGLLTRLEKLDH